MRSKLLIAGGAVMALVWACSHDFENPYDPGFNELPVIELEVTPEVPVVNQDLLFNGENSFDPDGGPLKYRLVRLEVNSNPSVAVLKVWNEYPIKVVKPSFPAEYVFSYEVRDDEGAVVTTEFRVTVQDSAGGGGTDYPPYAAIVPSDTFVVKNGTVNFDAGPSEDVETPKSQLKFSWQFVIFGDTLQPWSAVGSSSNLTEQKTFYTGGHKMVWLLVEDLDGNRAVSFVTFPVELTVGNNYPFANFTVSPHRGTETTDFTFDASLSADPESGTLQYAWDWDGNGTLETGWLTDSSRLYTFSGRHGMQTVKLLVKDDANNVSEAQVQVFIE